MRACWLQAAASRRLDSTAPPLPSPSCRSAFLPDRGREAAEAALRESLRAEFLAAQEATKKEKLEIVYSYWDGTGHRRTSEACRLLPADHLPASAPPHRSWGPLLLAAVTVPKGTTIGKFLEWVRQDLIEDFPEVRPRGVAECSG